MRMAKLLLNMLKRSLPSGIITENKKKFQNPYNEGKIMCLFQPLDGGNAFFFGLTVESIMYVEEK